VLNIQTAGTTAIAISASQAVTMAGSLASTGNAAFGGGDIPVASGFQYGIGVGPNGLIGTRSTGNDYRLLIGTNSKLDGTYRSTSSQPTSVFTMDSGITTITVYPAGTAGNAYGTATATTTFNANGVLALQGASTTATGVGITFPATQSASSNANTLDDYEEGTWTPTLTLTTPGTFSTLAPVGVYTKVGNLVTATGRISFTKGTGSGDLVLGGLPFTSINTATYQNAGSLSTDTFGAAGKVYQIVLSNNTTVPNLISVTQAGGATAAAGVSDFGATQAAIRYTFSYHV
jgi:hypothetical protein